MIVHRVKIEPRYIERLLSGQKTFEIRKNDRDYQVGDRLSMYPYYPSGTFIHHDTERRNVEADIVYMSTAYQQEGYCVLGIELVQKDV